MKAVTAALHISSQPENHESNTIEPIDSGGEPDSAATMARDVLGVGYGIYNIVMIYRKSINDKERSSI